MMGISYNKMTVNELLSSYASAGILYGTCSKRGKYRVANKQAHVMIDVYCELRARGPDAKRSLLILVEHIDDSVRLWAATHSLEFAPEEGQPVLEALALEANVVGIVARGILQEWRKGTLKFP